MSIFPADSIHAESLTRRGHREEAATYCKNWIENTLKDAEDGKIIPLLSVHVFNALGLDSTP